MAHRLSGFMAKACERLSQRLIYGMMLIKLMAVIIKHYA